MNPQHRGEYLVMSISHNVTVALKRLTALAATGVLALGAGFGQPAHAAGAVAGYVGEAPSSVAGCPYIQWRLQRLNNGPISGFASYSDASGVSAVTGTAGSTADQLHLVLKSVAGNGPTGTVVATKSADGTLVAKLTGEGCANMEVKMTPTPDLKQLNPNPNGTRP